MFHCSSCKRYPEGLDVMPLGSYFPVESYLVTLTTNERPATMPKDGSDVEGLSDNTIFASGSLLYVSNDGDNSEVYVYIDGNFELWDSPIRIDDRRWI